jgi:hypothetical protein
MNINYIKIRAITLKKKYLMIIHFNLTQKYLIRKIIFKMTKNFNNLKI